VVATFGCGRCGGEPAVAELVAAAGDVTADDAVAPVAFAPAAVGRRFVIGEAVRTGVGATADLTMVGGASLHVDPESVVRFSRTAESTRLDVEEGSTVVENTTTAPIEIETVFGTAHLEGSTRARIGPDEARFVVMVGHATVEREGEGALDVEVGQAVDVSGLVSAGVSALAPTPPPSAPPAPPPAPMRSVAVHGEGATVRAPDSDAFVSLPGGDREVVEGSVLRGAAGTSLDIATADGSVHVEGEAEVALVPGGAARLAHGSFRAEGGDRSRIELPGGVLVLSGGERASSAEVELARDGGGTVTVRRGQATHETSAGTTALAAPDSLTLGARGAASDSVADEVPAPSAGGGALSVAAGDSVVVHDPSAPTAIRFEPPAGCGEASWRFTGPGAPRAQSSSAPIVVAIRPGIVRYAVRCAGASEQRGSVRVDRDAGRAQLPRTAPRTVVDADGRPYNVLYQTLLPEILFRWPRASGHGPYEVEVRRGGSTRTVHTATPSYTFDSGAIGEGASTLTFRASDGAVSPPTTVRIQFDNATPVASLRAPAPGADLAGTVHVEGTAAEGASVSVDGAAVPVGDGGRFSADVAVGEGACLAVRIAVPARGTHYYVRCGR
jgi:hypothetical protein